MKNQRDTSALRLRNAQNLLRWGGIVLLLLALLLLLRSFQAPGNAIISGVLTAQALVLLALGAGEQLAQRIFTFNYIAVAAVGFFAAAIWGTIVMLEGLPFFHALWSELSLPLVGTVGTPVLLALAAYVVIAGVTTGCALLFVEAWRTTRAGTAARVRRK